MLQFTSLASTSLVQGCEKPSQRELEEKKEGCIAENFGETANEIIEVSLTRFIRRILLLSSKLLEKEQEKPCLLNLFLLLNALNQGFSADHCSSKV